jgi:hypothetical protein
MRSVKAVYENGHLMFPDGSVPEGRMEVVVVFPDQGESSPPRDKDAGKRFVRQWTGILKGANIEGWKDRRIAEIGKKPQ